MKQIYYLPIICFCALAFLAQTPAVYAKSFSDVNALAMTESKQKHKKKKASKEGKKQQTKTKKAAKKSTKKIKEDAENTGKELEQEHEKD